MLVGQSIGPFDILKELGSGAMGTVYQAKYTKTNAIVAIKMISIGLLGNEGALARFEREATILKQLRHPNIVRLFATGRYRSTPFFAMEYIQGESMDHVLNRKGRMTWQEVVSIGKQLCAALQHAHEKGIIHRDLKPSNLMIVRDGTMKLTDFGIAKDSDLTALTGANSTIGTAAYMSPEQCRGEKTLNAKSDLYSMGIVFYELLTGRKPFTAESPVDMFLMHVNGTFERPSRHVMDVPSWLDTLICQLLEKKPEHRPLDAAMVLKALEEIEARMEDQRSAAAQLANARVADAPRVTADLDQQDLEAARALKKGTKKNKGKSAKAKARTQSKMFQAIGLSLALVGLIALTWILTRPESAEKLLDRVHVNEAIKNPDENQRAALRESVQKYLNSYGNRTDAETERLRSYEREFEVLTFESQLQKRYRANMKPDDGYNVDAYKLVMTALKLEDDGDLKTARAQWQQLAEKFPGNSPDKDIWTWGTLANRKLRLISVVEQYDPYLLAQQAKLQKEEQDWVIEGENERLAVQAFRMEVLGDLSHARDSWAQLKEATRTDMTDSIRIRYLQSASKIRTLESQITTRTTAEDVAARKALLQSKLTAIDELKESTDFLLRKEARNLCRELRDLYKNDPHPDVVALASQATRILPTILVNSK